MRNWAEKAALKVKSQILTPAVSANATFFPGLHLLK
jgi:hypothetical protein